MKSVSVYAGLGVTGKKIKDKLTGSEIALTKNGIDDIIKVTRSLKNRGMLLKGTTKKITSEEGGFLNFPRPLMSAFLPLMKNVLTPLAQGIKINGSRSSFLKKTFLDQKQLQ